MTMSISKAMSVFPAMPGTPADLTAATFSKAVASTETEEERLKRIERVQIALKLRLQELDTEIRILKRRDPADPQLVLLLEGKNEVFNSLVELSAKENVPLFTIADKPIPAARVAATQQRPAVRPNANGGRVVDADGFTTPPKHLVARKKAIRNVPTTENPVKRTKIDNIKDKLVNEAEKEVSDNDNDNENNVNMDLAPPLADVTRKEKRPPPFFITICPEWDVILASIRVLAPDVVPKIIKNNIRFYVANAAEHLKVSQYLKGANIPFRTFRLDSETPVKVVCRGLPIYTKVENIKAELEELGFKIMGVTQLKRGPKTKSIAMPLYYVQIVKLPDFQLIYSVTLNWILSCFVYMRILVPDKTAIIT